MCPCNVFNMLIFAKEGISRLHCKTIPDETEARRKKHNS